MKENCEYRGLNRRERCENADLAAKEAVKQTFAILGVDVDNPQQVEEFRKSLRFGDAVRRIADKGFVMAMLAIASWLFWSFGSNHKLGG